MDAHEPPTIGAYGLVGDTRTAALVSPRGSVDWMCFPRFDSAPLFSQLVDAERGGSFAIEPEDVRSVRRRYLEGSVVLETTWTTPTGEASLLDGLVTDTSASLLPQCLLVRVLTCHGGWVRGSVRFAPTAGWSGEPLELERRHGRLVGASDPAIMTLTTEPELAIRPGTPAAFELRAGERLVLALGIDHRRAAVFLEPDAAVRALHATDVGWRRWLGEPEPLADGTDAAVRRSLLALRTLMYAPSGAPVAAPTTSIPEVPGGSRNWDYRYAWIRDASMAVSAFLACGFEREARAFLWWMLHASRLTRPRLHVLYDVLGRVAVEEREIPGPSGYRGARPVRVGNAAVDQFQLDAYGWMIDAGWAYLRHTGDLYGELWRMLQGHAGVLVDRWRDPDHGIWELRGSPRHYLHSKVMAWIGLDRALRIGDRLGARATRRARWSATRAAIADDVRRRGFDASLGSYAASYGSSELDAAILALPIASIEPQGSPRMLATIRAVADRLGAGGPLVYRSRPDGEGAFLPCSFWLSRALAETGRVDEAREVLEATIGLASELGLFGEELDPRTGEQLGNFPLGFTHAALIEAAAALGRAEAISRTGTRRGSLRR